MQNLGQVVHYYGHMLMELKLKNKKVNLKGDVSLGSKKAIFQPTPTDGCPRGGARFMNSLSLVPEASETNSKCGE